MSKEKKIVVRQGPPQGETRIRFLFRMWERGWGTRDDGIIVNGAEPQIVFFKEAANEDDFVQLILGGNGERKDRGDKSKNNH